VIFNVMTSNGAQMSTGFLTNAVLNAAKQGDLKLLTLLSQSGADLSVSNYDRVRFVNRTEAQGVPLTAMQSCYTQAHDSHEKFTDVLCFPQRSALHIAAYDGQVLALLHLASARVLNVNVTDQWDLTPLDYAIAASEWPCAVLLLSQGGVRYYVLPGHCPVSKSVHDAKRRMCC
jgi:hypothetical protein